MVAVANGDVIAFADSTKGQSAVPTETVGLTKDMIGFKTEAEMAALFSADPAFKALPIVDLAQYKSEDPAVREQFLKQLTDVLLNVGFMYLKNHGISPETEKAMFEKSAEAINLPREEKAKFSMDLSPIFKGWSELGRETTYGKIDMRETIGLGWDLPRASSDGPVWGNSCGPITWPTVDGFKDTAKKYLEEVHGTATTLLAAISETLGKPKEYLREFFLDEVRPNHHFQINYYPSVDLSAHPEYKENLGDAAHVDDPVVLTCLNQDMIGGLQVMNFEGEWIDVVPIPGTIIVNTGTYLEFITGGRYVATTHRVRLNTSGVGRYSMPYFMIPKLEMQRIPPALPVEELPPYIVQNAPTVKKRYDELGFNYRVARNVGEYWFYVKMMKSFPAACAIHYPGFDWRAELGVTPEDAKRYL
ncbi:hypothetical protein DFJ74DRAFT_665638 [Hyaloraphidium curvatum]|nr:hypothetical protein DFJ74DRAFT_665638 [Hyaloraphidium curvatum]